MAATENIAMKSAMTGQAPRLSGTPAVAARPHTTTAAAAAGRVRRQTMPTVITAPVAARTKRHGPTMVSQISAWLRTPNASPTVTSPLEGRCAIMQRQRRPP